MTGRMLILLSLAFAGVSGSAKGQTPGILYTVNGMLGPVLGCTPAGAKCDPLDLGGKSFTATTTIAADTSTSNPGASATYTGLTVTITAAGAPPLSCKGATAVIMVVSPAQNGTGATFALSNCTLAGLAPLTSDLAFPPNTVPSPIPLPFASVNLVSGSQVAYTFGGVDTVLGVSGNANGTCQSCPVLILNPTVLTFSAQVGGAPPAQSVGVSTGGTGLSYLAVAATQSGGNWLSASPAFAVTGSSLTVSVNPAGLGGGTYTGAVTVYTAGMNAPQTVMVTLSLGGSATLIPNPSSFTFNWVTGAATPTQPLSVTTSNNGAVPYTVTTATTDGNPWLTVSPSSGTTGGAAITVTADPTKVPGGGTYSGTLTITASGESNSPLQVPVAFTVTEVGVSPSSMTFVARPKGPNPAPRSLTVTSTASLPAAGFSAAATTSTGGNWLSVSPTSGTANGPPLMVSVNDTGLAAGSYDGAISITPAGAMNPIQVPVTLTDARNVVYSVTGTFATPPVSGADPLKLAGQPFQLMLVANEAARPVKHGQHYGQYENLAVRGSLGSAPIKFANDSGTLVLLVHAAYDGFELQAKAAKKGTKLPVTANVHLPKGTLTGLRVQPLANAVTLNAANAIVTYGAGKQATALAVSAGTLTGVVGK
jgi:hypothetical protein